MWASQVYLPHRDKKASCELGCTYSFWAEECEMSPWQDEARRCGVVLREVFPWLPAQELARAGAVCRAWRQAAADPPLWRRLFRAELVDLAAAHSAGGAQVSWQQEYVRARAGWRLAARELGAAGAALLCVDLARDHATLALGADDGSVALWRREPVAWRQNEPAAWRQSGHCAIAAHGLARASRVQWAECTAPRLLVAGPRLLADDWLLVILLLDDECSGGTVASRVRCSPGGAGCWASAAGDAFLSLELRLLAPALAVTTVRLNAATQETQSEYAGVTTSLLTIFNEERAHITHAFVAGEGGRTLVAGTARWLAVWPVAQERPSPLLAGAAGELAERVRRHRARTAPAPDDAPPPSEDAVRAACAPPDWSRRFAAPLLGLAAAGAGRWLWAVCGDGSATCMSARDLRVLRELRAPGTGPGAPHSAPGAGPGAPHSAPGTGPPAHYVQPAVSDYYVASPEGSYSQRVWTWSLCSGAASPCGAGHRGPAVSAVLPHDEPGAMLVLAADTLYVWRLARPLPGTPGSTE